MAKMHGFLTLNWVTRVVHKFAVQQIHMIICTNTGSVYFPYTYLELSTNFQSTGFNGVLCVCCGVGCVCVCVLGGGGNGDGTLEEGMTI